MAATQQPEWRASLHLRVERDPLGSRLETKRHTGPLRVQRVFYPEGREVPHIYILHPPGALVGGDDIEILCEIDGGASALITTPAAQKIYRSKGIESRQRCTVRVGEHGSVEWFPSETIVYEGAFARQSTRIELSQGAAIMGWEITCFGRPASGDGFAQGRFVQSLEIARGGETLFLERARTVGGSATLSEPWGHAGFPVQGYLYCVPRVSSDVSNLGELVRASVTFGHGAVTALDDALLVRAQADQVERVRAEFEKVWEVLRPHVLGRGTTAPRIWAT